MDRPADLLSLFLQMMETSNLQLRQFSNTIGVLQLSDEVNLMALDMT